MWIVKGLGNSLQRREEESAVAIIRSEVVLRKVCILVGRAIVLLYLVFSIWLGWFWEG